jgi:hypothetical protein
VGYILCEKEIDRYYPGGDYQGSDSYWLLATHDVKIISYKPDFQPRDRINLYYDGEGRPKNPAAVLEQYLVTSRPWEPWLGSGSGLSRQILDYVGHRVEPVDLT